jgi:phenylacetate-coenzyme A ligase PaaK-like adenylate-forming protein
MIQDFYILLKLLREFHLPKEKREALVTKRLKRVLCSAYDNTKYYKKLMDDSGYNPNVHYKDPDDLKKLRITTKKDLKENPVEDFINENARTKSIFTDSTSGSTGIPLKVYRNSIERKYQVAKWLRVLFLNGYKPFQKVVSFTSPARLNSGKSILQSLGILRRKPIDYLASGNIMVDEMFKYKPDVMYGNRSQFETIAEELIKRNSQPIELSMIFVGGEVVKANHLKMFNSVFKTKIRQIYGTVELGSIAFDYKNNNGMILNEDLTYCEFLNNKNQEAFELENCKFIGTDLIGEYMPFIRYDQGDILKYKYSGDRKYIVEIQGRDSDMIILPDGTKKTHLFFYEFFNQFQSIRKVRGIQTKNNEIIIEIDCELDYFMRIYDLVLDFLNTKISKQMTYTIKHESPIQPDKTGKIRMFKSELKSDE